MAKINILPAKVFNRISAAEVIERPYSVVKELVENSIDAGATNIEIYVENGGKQSIRVVDNGCGIERDDLHSAFLPHATSKIQYVEDLDRILTLGFRGEALASIAAISKMAITSKTKEGKCYRLTSDGGEFGEIVEVVGENGTEVAVEMLFFNTPVRYGFLKTDKGEESEITNFVTRFILNRPDISFTYYANGKKVLQSFGGGEEEALINVYGASILSNCYKINAEKHGIKIRGYIGNQNFSKPNKSYQNVYLNGRYIVNATISGALANAYSSYLMKRQYPFYVLYIDVPPEVVNVNSHPNKTDVRFADNQIIYGCIYSVIVAVLDGQTKALDYVVPNFIPPTIEVPKREEKKSEKEIREQPKKIAFTFDDLPKFTYEEAKKEMQESAPIFTAEKKGMALPFEGVKKETKGFIPMEQIGSVQSQKLVGNNDKNPQKGNKDAEKLHEQFPDLYFERQVLRVDDPAYTQQGQKREEVDFFAENKKFLEEMDAKSKVNKIDVSAFCYAGKLFNTYLLYENKDEVYIIDQHAAHERLIFNRLKEQMQNRTVLQQPMLLPYALELNVFESSFIKERIEDIRAMGFDIEEFESNTFKISAIPLDLQHIDLGKFFNEILGDISGFRSIKLEELLKDKLASAACKAAVKGGMDLTKEEMDALFILMDGDMGLKCPHGRPVVVKLTKTELEKMFKRIV